MVVGAKDCGESGKRIRIRRTTNSRREAYSERCRWSFAEAFFYLCVGSCLVYTTCVVLIFLLTLLSYLLRHCVRVNFGLQTRELGKNVCHVCLKGNRRGKVGGHGVLVRENPERTFPAPRSRAAAHTENSTQ